MANFSNSRNEGVMIGGNAENSSITVNRAAPAGGVDEAEVLRQLNELFTRLVTDALQLSPQQAGAAAQQAAELKAAVTAPQRDRSRIAAALGALKGTVATAAPLAEMAAAIAELVGHLH